MGCKRGHARGGRAAAVAAGFALLLQALLLTFAPPSTGAASQAAAASHHAAHDGHEHAPAPPPAPAHRHEFCCILGDKLGTALATPPSAAALPARLSAPTAAEKPQAETVDETARPRSPFRARAPPVA